MQDSIGFESFEDLAEYFSSEGVIISNAIEYYNLLKGDSEAPEGGYENFMNEYMGEVVIAFGELSSTDGVLTTDLEHSNVTLEVPCKPQDCFVTAKYENTEKVFKFKIDQYEIAMFGAHYEDRYVAIDTVGKKMLRIESVDAFEHEADNLKGFELVDSPLYGVNYFSITYGGEYMYFNIKRLKLITNEAVIDKYF